MSTNRRTKLRAVLYKAQNGKCCYCKRPVWLCEKPETKKDAMERLSVSKRQVRKRRATLDHLTPKSEGGSNYKGNFALACNGCNSERGSMNWLEFATRKDREMEALKPQGWEAA